MIAQYGQGANDGNRDGGCGLGYRWFSDADCRGQAGRGCRYAVLSEGNAV